MVNPGLSGKRSKNVKNKILSEFLKFQTIAKNKFNFRQTLKSIKAKKTKQSPLNRQTNLRRKLLRMMNPILSNNPFRLIKIIPTSIHIPLKAREITT